MYLLLGNSHMESHDYERAVQSFERARTQMKFYVGPPLFSISLVSFLPTISHHVEQWTSSLIDIWVEV